MNKCPRDKFCISGCLKAKTEEWLLLASSYYVAFGKDIHYNISTVDYPSLEIMKLYRWCGR